MADRFEDLPLLQRYLILTGAGMGSSKRGIQQLLHGVGVKNKTLGTTDTDIKDIEYAQKAVDRLSEATPGGWAADMAGQFADPATLLAGPLAKAAIKGTKGALAAARAGGLTGALSSGLAETREGDSRLGNMALGGATNTLGDVVGGVKKIWAGDKAELKALAKALNSGQKMEEGFQTLRSTERGAGPTRVWIDQSKTKFNPQVIEDMEAVARKYNLDENHYTGRLGDVLHAPDMYEAYPHLKDVPVTIRTGKDVKHGAMFDPTTGAISIDTDSLRNKRAHASIIHEVQHAVQKFEGTPSGDSIDRLEKLLPGQGAAAYVANPGEIEARDAAARALLDPANQQGHEIYTLHAQGPNAPFMEALSDHLNRPDIFPAKNGLPLSPLAADVHGVLRSDDPTGILAQSMQEPLLAHLMPLDTREINAKSIEKFKNYQKTQQNPEQFDITRMLRFMPGNDYPFTQ